MYCFEELKKNVNEIKNKQLDFVSNIFSVIFNKGKGFSVHDGPLNTHPLKVPHK